MKTCFYCTDVVHTQVIDYETIHNGHAVRVSGVPAQVCPNCGEIYIEPEISMLIDEALEGAPPGALIVELHVLST